jgi:hypothetical protein
MEAGRDEECEDLPPPAYGSDEEPVPSYPKPAPIRNTHWYTIMSVFWATRIYNNESTKPYIRTPILEAVPLFAYKLTQSYSDVELTVFGNILKSQLPTYYGMKP